MLLLLILTALVAQISSETPPQIEPRIIGGSHASNGQFPYYAIVLKDKMITCGGAIISKTFILTAAHCVYKLAKNRITVKVGIIELFDRNAEYLNPKEIIIHPEYRHKSYDSDLALIKLSKQLKLGSGNVNKIELSTAGLVVSDNTMATIAGFGSINSDNEMSRSLKYIHVPIWTRATCKRFADEKFVCAGDLNGKEGACYGDSGGALVLKGKLYGIASNRMRCGDEQPVLYTYVPAFRSWIRKYVNL